MGASWGVVVRRIRAREPNAGPDRAPGGAGRGPARTDSPQDAPGRREGRFPCPGAFGAFPGRKRRGRDPGASWGPWGPWGPIRGPWGREGPGPASWARPGRRRRGRVLGPCAASCRGAVSCVVVVSCGVLGGVVGRRGGRAVCGIREGPGVVCVVRPGRRRVVVSWARRVRASSCRRACRGRRRALHVVGAVCRRVRRRRVHTCRASSSCRASRPGASCVVCACVVSWARAVVVVVCRCVVVHVVGGVASSSCVACRHVPNCVASCACRDVANCVASCVVVRACRNVRKWNGPGVVS